MKIPSNKEEYLVWPPLGAGLGIFIGTTVAGVFTQYHELLLAQEGSGLFAGYAFPVIMAFAFAWRFHGKYWLGFAWLGVIVYCLAWLLSLFNPTVSVFASLLMLFSCLSILFEVQASVLYLKRVLWQLDS